MTTYSCVSTEEVLTESISSVRSGPLYDSDVFESTFSSETCTLDHLSDSHTNPTSSLHSSSSLTDKSNTPNEDDTYYEERTPPSCIDPADEQYLSPAEVFVNQKLEVLRVKLESRTETSSAKDASDSTVQALLQTNTSLQHSKRAEKTYIEACLGRLNVSECPSVNQSRSTQSTIGGTTKPFIAQYERLKMESLQHTMEMQIKRLADEIDEHYQAFTCAECRNQQHEKAEKEFVYQKLKLLTQTEFKEKLDKHLYQMDSLSLLGDIVRSCMRPSAPDGDVWKAMADKMTQLKKETQDNNN